MLRKPFREERLVIADFDDPLELFSALPRGPATSDDKADKGNGVRGDGSRIKSIRVFDLGGLRRSIEEVGIRDRSIAEGFDDGLGDQINDMGKASVLEVRQDSSDQVALTYLMRLPCFEKGIFRSLRIFSIDPIIVPLLVALSNVKQPSYHGIVRLALKEPVNVIPCGECRTPLRPSA